MPADFVARQIDSVFADLAVKAVKIGMLSQTAVIAAVAEGLARRAGSIPVVLDPVMVATSGDRLITDAAVATLRERLLPRADLITPNLPEAAVLLGEPVAADAAAIVAQARRLVALGARAVLIKGGHGTGRESIDHLVTADGALRTLSAPRIATRNTHGTGCTLSAAVAAGLAQGLALPEAVAEAKAYLDGRPRGGGQPRGRNGARAGPPLPRRLVLRPVLGRSRAGAFRCARRPPPCNRTSIAFEEAHDRSDNGTVQADRGRCRIRRNGPTGRAGATC